MNRIIYACDIGSVRSGKFAWARIAPGTDPPATSTDIDDLVARLGQDVKNGMSIALGFESPLFMPVPTESADLGRGRSGEGNRSMFASTGATAATLGIHEAAWILRAIHDQSGGTMAYSLDWKLWPPKGVSQTLLLWEAFVSGPAHGASDEQDAATAAAFFREHEAQLDQANSVTTNNSLCLVHAVAIWAGWATDHDRLHGACLVLKPDQPCVKEFRTTPLGCLCCQSGIPFKGKRICPLCDHVFRGNGWDGIDAHWKSRHQSVVPYEKFWGSLCHKHRSR